MIYWLWVLSGDVSSRVSSIYWAMLNWMELGCKDFFSGIMSLLVERVDHVGYMYIWDYIHAQMRGRAARDNTCQTSIRADQERREREWWRLTLRYWWVLRVYDDDYGCWACHWFLSELKNKLYQFYLHISEPKGKYPIFWRHFL